jgi:hypothetical protein
MLSVFFIVMLSGVMLIVVVPIVMAPQKLIPNPKIIVDRI